MADFDRLHIRPYQLMCVVCAQGEDGKERCGRRILEILRTIRAHPDMPVMLRCNVDSVYRYQNPGREEDTPEGDLFNEKRDLDILQKLGLVPGDIRPARQLLRRSLERIVTSKGICGYRPAAAKPWRGCHHAFTGRYEKGHARGMGAIIPPRDGRNKARSKVKTAKAVYEADALQIRPHHLMCMACFAGARKDLVPIAEDNLFEAIDVIRRQPAIPITLVRGCCMVCPPCSSYDPKSDLCIAESGMALRDQKKDIDLLQRLGLKYGDTLSARELYSRLFRAVESTRQICGYGDGIVRGWEWSICGGPDGNEAYRKARETGMRIKGLRKRA